MDFLKDLNTKLHSINFIPLIYPQLIHHSKAVRKLKRFIYGASLMKLSGEVKNNFSLIEVGTLCL